MDGSLNLLEASLRILGTGLRALVDEVDTFDNSLLLIYQDLQHLTSLALVLTGQNIDGIVFLDM
jgi:hypothetical protein